MKTKEIDVSDFDLEEFLSTALDAQIPQDSDEPPLPPRSREWVAADSGPRHQVAVTERRAEFTLVDAPAIWKPPSSKAGSRLSERSGPYSFKNDRTCLLIGRLEREQFLHLEYDHEIESFIERPFRLMIEGTRRIQVRPNFFALQRGKPTIIICRWEASASRNEARNEIVGSAISSIGFDCKIHTERHLQNNTRAANFSIIDGARHVPPLTGAALKKLHDLLKQGGITVAQAVTEMAIENAQPLHKMIGRGDIVVDLNIPLEQAVLRSGV